MTTQPERDEQGPAGHGEDAGGPDAVGEDAVGEDAVGEDAVDEPLPSERARDEGQGGRPGFSRAAPDQLGD